MISEPQRQPEKTQSRLDAAWEFCKQSPKCQRARAWQSRTPYPCRLRLLFEIWEELGKPNKLLIQALQEHNFPVWDKLHIILDLAEKKNNEIYPIILNFME